MRYGPAGICIYCRAGIYAVDSKRLLAEEHVIPYGLNGDIVLPEATCRRCERITGRLESILQRGSLLACRSILGLKTRNPKDRPKHLPLYINNLKVEVDVRDYPSTLALARFSSPYFLCEGGGRDETFDLWLRVFKYNTKILRERYGLRRYSPPIIPISTVRRVLAKIGHSFAVAELGVDAFEPFLEGVIIDEAASQDALRYVGGTKHVMPADEDCLHWIEIESLEKGGGNYVIVNIRLFANIDESPIYNVVVGKLNSKGLVPGAPIRRCVGSVGVLPPPEPGPDEPIQMRLYGRH